MNDILESNKVKKYSARHIITIVTLAAITIFRVVLDYVQAGFDADIFAQSSYWINLAIQIITVALVVLVAYNFMREQEMQNNLDLKNANATITLARNTLYSKNLATTFETHIISINSERKATAYKNYLQHKIHKSKNEKAKDKYLKLLVTADSDISFLPSSRNKIKISPFKTLKYNKLKSEVIFSGVKQNTTEDDSINANESRHIANLLSVRILGIIALSILTTSLTLGASEFSFATLINSFVVIIQILFSASAGASEAKRFVSDTLLQRLYTRINFVQRFLEAEKSKTQEVLT